MTRVDATYRFTTPYQDDWNAAIERLHGVYGLESLKLGANLETLQVTWDASRLKTADVDHLLRQAALPVVRA